MTNEAKYEVYDEDYFERGISTGKSGYDNYSWLPEMSIKFAYKIIKELGLRDKDKVLDIGCAKGYMVKALRILDIDAYGYDVSKYAISKTDQDIKEYCKLSEKGDIPFDFKFDHLLSKDVFEHFEEKDLNLCLENLLEFSDKLFVIVPLGENNKFIVPAYEMDITHKLAKPREWWEDKFESKGWDVSKSAYLIPGMKENWNQYKKGNGFFFLEKN